MQHIVKKKKKNMKPLIKSEKKKPYSNDPVVKISDQKIYFFYGIRFKPYDY